MNWIAVRIKNRQTYPTEVQTKASTPDDIRDVQRRGVVEQRQSIACSLDPADPLNTGRLKLVSANLDQWPTVTCPQRRVNFTTNRRRHSEYSGCKKPEKTPAAEMTKELRNLTDVSSRQPHPMSGL